MKAPNPIDRQVGARARMQRLRLGMSEEKLAEVIGVSVQQIQKYENGTNRIGASRLHQLGGALNVPLASFFEEPAANSGSVTPPDGETSDEEAVLAEVLASVEGAELNRAFHRIRAPQLRKSIVSLVISLAASADDDKKHPANDI